MPTQFYQPKVLGDVKWGRHVIASDPGWCDPKFDTSRLHEELWENVRFDARPGKWLVVQDRIPLNERNKEFLTTGDDELDRELETSGVAMFVVVHADIYDDYRELVDQLSYGIHVNIESGNLGFCDEPARRDPRFYRRYVDSQGEILDGRAVTVPLKSDGPQPLYALWEGDEVVMLATEISD